MLNAIFVKVQSSYKYPNRMIRSLLAMALLSALTQTQSCNSDEKVESGSSETHTVLEGQVIAFDLPDSVRVNETITFNVQFEGGTNGCAEPVNLVPEAEDFRLTVRAYYKVPKVEQMCTMVVPLHELPLTYTFKQAGTYELRSGNQTPLHTLIVTEDRNE